MIKDDYPAPSAAPAAPDNNGTQQITRLEERLDAVYRLGTGTGANRVAYTSAENEAHDLVAGWFEEAGLLVSRDAVGNLYGRLPGREPELGEIWSGSHLDSVPTGGRLDGVLGVLGAIEAVERIGQQRRTLTIVAFRNEEGVRFGRGCFGSRALCGQLQPGELDGVDAQGNRLGDVLPDAAAVAPAGWLDPLPAAYVEYHIEQGPRLAQMGQVLGVAPAIAGVTRLRVRFTGTASHAGTTPMETRDDALVKASEYVLAVRRAAAREGLEGEMAVATVGAFSVEPNAANVIPGEVNLMIDARGTHERRLAELIDDMKAAASAAAECEVVLRSTPVQMDPELSARLVKTLNELGHDAPLVPSFAGHDARIMASVGVPTLLLFVRSPNGLSHSPDEHTDPVDLAVGVEALAAALSDVAETLPAPAKA